MGATITSQFIIQDSRQGATLGPGHDGAGMSPAYLDAWPAVSLTDGVLLGLADDVKELATQLEVQLYRCGHSGHLKPSPVLPAAPKNTPVPREALTPTTVLRTAVSQQRF